MKRTLILAVTLVALALPAFAAQPDAIFTRYEEARQALLGGSIPAVQKAAQALATTAAKQPAIAQKANALAKAADLTAARTAFAALSDEVIKYHSTVKGERPVVAYCSMVKKSWLQPAGEIGNPYVSAGMRTCGEIK